MNTQNAARPLHDWTLSAVNLADVAAGDYIVLDPVYGVERVAERFEHKINDFPGGDQVSSWPVLRLHLTRHSAEDGVVFSRYVVRFPHEPCLRVAIEGPAR